LITGKMLQRLSFSSPVSTPAENLKLAKTFAAWMDEHANFRTICEEGKGIPLFQ